jgi:septum formation protein
MSNKLILASASARRKKLLTEAGFDFDVVIPMVEETTEGNSVLASVIENARRKNRWVANLFPGRPVLSADTSIEFESRCIGKPLSRDEAFGFMKMFSGKTHIVLTSVAFSCSGADLTVETAESMVTFRHLTDTLIAEYFKLVDPMDKAGAYDIGQHGEMIVQTYTGSFTNIVGLPMELVKRLLSKIQGSTP